MDKKSKALLAVMAILVIASIGYTYYKTVVLNDFEIVNTEEEEVVADTPEETTGEEAVVEAEIL
jgi:hypothetical protein